MKVYLKVLVALVVLINVLIVSVGTNSDMSFGKLGLAMGDPGGSGNGWIEQQDYLYQVGFCYGDEVNMPMGGGLYIEYCTCKYSIGICPLGSVDDCTEEGEITEIERYDCEPTLIGWFGFKS